MKSLMINRKVTLTALIASLALIALFASACGGNPLTFSPAQMPEAAAGQDYQVSITITGNKTPVGQIGMDSGTLPAGLNITYDRGQSSALISGKPQSPGRFNFTIGARCMGTNQAGQAGHIDYTLVVK
jgi:hypothetical protein